MRAYPRRPAHRTTISDWPAHLTTVFALVGLLGWAAPPLVAQDAAGADAESASQGLPRLFFDCQGPQCNDQYYRTEIGWVSWVRDQQDADVHVIMTSQNTGAGGREYILDFMGREEYSDFESESLYRSLSTDTERERLDGVTRTLALGLAQFANFAGYRNLVSLQALEMPGGGTPGGLVDDDDVDDPWNLWIFRINGNGNFDGESSRQTVRLRGGVSASRVTPTWKMNYRWNMDYENREIDRADEPTFVFEQTDWDANALVAYSLAEHWSIGLNSRLGSNLDQNQEFMIQLNPAIEYSFFPYQEATRRSLTAFYEIGPVYRDYEKLTILGELSETRAEHALTLNFSQRQTWGDANVTLQASSYLHDFGLYNLEARGRLSFRITRGLDLNVGGSYAQVRDQVYLAEEDLSEEERLLDLRQTGTDYEASLFVGLSFQFGSIYNNVVNNRFPGGGGGGGGRGPF